MEKDQTPFNGAVPMQGSRTQNLTAKLVRLITCQNLVTKGVRYVRRRMYDGGDWYFIMVHLLLSRQRVGYRIVLTLDVLNSQIKFRQVLQPASLAPAECTLSEKVGQRVMIRHDVDFHSHKHHLPLVECMNHSKKLLLVNRLILLGRRHLLRFEHDR